MSRRNARHAKAAAVAPRPVDRLRPVVRCPTIKYNRRARSGRGFSLAELKVRRHARPADSRWTGVQDNTASRIPDITTSQYTDISQAAGIPRQLAQTIGISVDGRRQNLSEEGLAANVARLKAYQERLILFPRKAGKPKKGDSPADLTKTETVSKVNATLPIEPLAAGFTEISKSDLPAPHEDGAYRTLRLARADHRHQGKREKRARDKAEAEAAAKK